MVDILGSNDTADHAHRRSMVGLVEVGSVEKDARRRELGPKGEVPVSMRSMPPTAPIKTKSNFYPVRNAQVDDRKN